MSDELRDENVYFQTREEQLLHGLERRHGLSRRQLLLLGAASLPVLAGFGRVASPQAARAARRVGSSPIQKPLPPEWFDVFPTNAEMRWDAAGDLGYTIPNERFFVRDHTLTPVIDASGWRLNVFGTGLKGAPDAGHPVQFTYNDLSHAAPRRHLLRRMRRQRPQLLRHAAGDAGRRHPVAPRRDRRREVARRPAVGGPEAREDRRRTPST